jgi:hypothetical protein
MDERRQTMSNLILKEISNRKTQDPLLVMNVDGDPDLKIEQEKV